MSRRLFQGHLITAKAMLLVLTGDAAINSGTRNGPSHIVFSVDQFFVLLETSESSEFESTSDLKSSEFLRPQWVLLLPRCEFMTCQGLALFSVNGQCKAL